MSNLRLSAYIAEQTKRGQTLDQIKTTLLSLGWAAPEVEAALAEPVSPPQPVTASPAPETPPPPVADPLPAETPSAIPAAATPAPPSPAPDEAAAHPQSTHSVMFSQDEEPSPLSRNILRAVFIILLVVILGLGGYSALNSQRQEPPAQTTPDFSGAITEPELTLATPPAAVAGDQTYTYSHPNPRFSLTFPGSWKPETSPSGPTLVFYANPASDSQDGASIRPGINVIAQPTSAASMSAEFAAQNQQDLRTTYPDYQPTRIEPVNLADGTPAYLIGGVFSQSNLKVRNLQLLAIKNGQLFVVTATTFPSAWPQHETTFENSLLSFTFR